MGKDNEFQVVKYLFLIIKYRKKGFIKSERERKDICAINTIY